VAHQLTLTQSETRPVQVALLERFSPFVALGGQNALFAMDSVIQFVGPENTTDFWKQSSTPV